VADLTWSEFKADLAQMQAAMGSVKRESDHINDLMGQISKQFSAVKPAWTSPSEASFDDVQTWFTKVSGDLHALLEEIAKRLHQAYDNYHAAEQSNYNNLS
jgi:WXG100 family type VII secretion target